MSVVIATRFIALRMHGVVPSALIFDSMPPSIFFIEAMTPAYHFTQPTALLHFRLIPLIYLYH